MNTILLLFSKQKQFLNDEFKLNASLPFEYAKYCCTSKLEKYFKRGSLLCLN